MSHPFQKAGETCEADSARPRGVRGAGETCEADSARPEDSACLTPVWFKSKNWFYFLSQSGEKLAFTMQAFLHKKNIL